MSEFLKALEKELVRSYSEFQLTIEQNLSDSEEYLSSLAYRVEELYEQYIAACRTEKVEPRFTLPW